MARITELTLARSSVHDIHRNRTSVDQLRNQVSSGLRVEKPGDDDGVAATIAQLGLQVQRNDRHKLRINNVRSTLNFQEGALEQATQILVRAKEIATQAANESNGTAVRAQMASEVFALRDHMASLANSQYQGRYVFAGVDDDDPPFDAATYTLPATGDASQRYVFDAETGTDQTKSVKVTDDLSVDVNTPGDGIFSNALFALERLGRALAGYDTLPASGAPDGTGNAYTFPTDTTAQTQAILGSIDLIDTARQSEIGVEQTSVAGRLSRLDSADSLLDASQVSLKEVLGRLQAADSIESVSLLTQAQTSLEASLAVTARILNVSILDYI